MRVDLASMWRSRTRTGNSRRLKSLYRNAKMLPCWQVYDARALKEVVGNKNETLHGRPAIPIYAAHWLYRETGNQLPSVSRFDDSDVEPLSYLTKTYGIINS
ncbi:hypothetical protein ACFE04_004579 [Oxalis oulophora]